MLNKTLLTSVVLLVAFFYCAVNFNTAGLKVLSWVKKISGNSVNLTAIQGNNTASIKHDMWTALLEKHVDNKGAVNYLGFRQEKEKLAKYLTQLSTHPPGQNWTETEQLAYWINAYNAFTVKLIVDHYPLKSIKEISDGLPMINSPWDIKFFEIGGTSFDLNTIEHEILRKQFEEPRIHFAINCASFSCPKLRNEAYTAARLEQQLEEQTISFLSDPTKNSITEKESKLSKLFDWFAEDFNKQSSLAVFIKKYHPQFNASNKIEYMKYDWSLNEK